MDQQQEKKEKKIINDILSYFQYYSKKKFTSHGVLSLIRVLESEREREQKGFVQRV